VYFGGTYCLHLQGLKVIQTRNKQKQEESSDYFFFLTLFFVPKDLGHMIHRNVGLSVHCTENSRETLKLKLIDFKFRKLLFHFLSRKNKLLKVKKVYGGVEV
jgi:hypothetical protein